MIKNHKVKIALTTDVVKTLLMTELGMQLRKFDHTVFSTRLAASDGFSLVSPDEDSPDYEVSGEAANVFLIGHIRGGSHFSKPQINHRFVAEGDSDEEFAYNKEAVSQGVDALHTKFSDAFDIVKGWGDFDEDSVLKLKKDLTSISLDLINNITSDERD